MAYAVICDHCKKVKLENDDTWIEFVVFPGITNILEQSHIIGDEKQLHFCSRTCIACFAMEGGFEDG